ncbi:MAG: hypothetical protein ACI9GW_001922 [Halieaceae bacterium]|jgi:hypothetical protein
MLTLGQTYNLNVLKMTEQGAYVDEYLGSSIWGQTKNYL